jgi:hypothetical protein
MDPGNWNSGTLPKAGDVVSFPPAFSQFGLGRCDPASTAPCIHGGVVKTGPLSSQASADISLTRLNLPTNGKLQFGNGTRVTFVERSVNSTKRVQWKDRGASSTDFMCANNWLVQGTSSNPAFEPPCYLDVAVFPEVGFSQVDFMLVHYAVRVFDDVCLVCVGQDLLRERAKKFFRWNHFARWKCCAQRLSPIFWVQLGPAAKPLSATVCNCDLGRVLHGLVCK